MEYCPRCGKPNETDGSFCPHCGKALRNSASPNKKRALLLGLIVLLAIATAILAGALRKDFSEDLDAIKRASASVVTIYTYDINGVEVATGSGFAALDRNIIVTGYHVIAPEAYSAEVITEAGDVYPVDSVLCHDAQRDIAVLSVPDCSLPPLKTNDGEGLKQGERLTAIGMSGTVSTGVFSNYPETDTHKQLLFTTPISPDSSGGALFNENGQVVGITSGSCAEGSDIHCAIPFGYVQTLYDNRTTENVQTLPELRNQTDHIYSVDYVLANARELAGQTITIQGYLSAVHYDGYLVSSFDSILWLDTRRKDLTEDERLLLQDEIELQYTNGISLRMSVPADQAIIENAVPGAHIVATGKVMIYEENNRGTDIRFVADTADYTD